MKLVLSREDEGIWTCDISIDGEIRGGGSGIIPFNIPYTVAIKISYKTTSNRTQIFSLEIKNSKFSWGRMPPDPLDG